MTYKNKSRWSTIIFICLSLTIVDKGWVHRTHSCEYVGGLLTKELLCATAYAVSLVAQALTNSHYSAADRELAQQINRITAHPATHAASTSNPSSLPQQVEIRHEYVHPAQSSKEPVSTAVKSVQQVNHQTQTIACAKEQDQKQVAAAVVTKKAQELIENISHDFRKQLEDSCRQTTKTVRVYHFTPQWQKDIPAWTTERHCNGGTTYYAPNPTFSFYIGPVKQTITQRLIDRSFDEYDQYRYAYQSELAEIQSDPDLCKQVDDIINTFIEATQKLVYGTLVERVSALVHLDSFKIGGITYGRWLEDTKKALYAAYCHKDGSICMEALRDMNAARDILLKACTNKQLFYSPAVWSTTKKRCKYLAKKTRHVDMLKIQQDATNQCCKQMLIAFSSGDMQQIEQIKNEHAHLQDLAVLYDVLQVRYDKFIAHQEALLHDDYGIIHFRLPVALADPLYLQLSTEDRLQLYNDKTALANFNAILKLRNLYKNTLHKTWNIPTTADAFVHQALYSLLDYPVIQDRIEKIHALVSNPDLSKKDRATLVAALFLPNGILKDFVHYERAQSLKMPTAILKSEHAAIRNVLNHVIYTEYSSDNIRVRQNCAHIIDLIQKAVAADNQQDADFYRAAAHDAYKALLHNPDDLDHNDPFDESKFKKTCGTSIAHDWEHNLPEDNNDGTLDEPKAGTCGTAQEQEHHKNNGCCGTSDNDHEIPEPKPCGLQGQTLPGLGSEDAAKQEDETQQSGNDSPEQEEDAQENDSTGQTSDESQDTSSTDENPVSTQEDSESNNDASLDQSTSIVDNLTPTIQPGETSIIAATLIPEIPLKDGFLDLEEVMVKVEGRGNTGRTDPNDYAEKLAMNEVMSNPQGRKLALTMQDPTWPAAEGWVKMHQSVEVYKDMTIEAGEHHPKPAKKYKVVIHYVYNSKSGSYDDFKFKDETKE